MTNETSQHPIPDEEWKSIVKNVPIVSVDLLVRVDDGIVLGKRRNEPARSEWFVPGGTVFKNERLRDAARRVAREELGVDITIDRCLGSYEHFYETADVDVDDGKHYLATAFVVHPEDEPIEPDDQHADVRTFSPPFPEFHPYVDRYLDAIGLLERAPVPLGEESYR